MELWWEEEREVVDWLSRGRGVEGVEEAGVEPGVGLSTTHILWALVATSFATVWARVE